jgi:gluconokinase
VSGTGKTTLGNAISKTFGYPYVEGDELHPPSNIAKMSSGQPLNDADREPWLKLIRDTAVKMTSKELERRPEAAEKTEVRIHEEREKKDVPVDLGEHHKADEGLRKSSPPGVVISCSSLKKYYRDMLRGTYSPEVPGNKDLKVEVKTNTPSPETSTTPNLATYFVFLEGSRDVLLDRMTKRQDHYMKANMLDSQLATLEDPKGEKGVITVSIEDSTEEQLNQIVETLDKVTGLDLTY